MRYLANYRRTRLTVDELGRLSADHALRTFADSLAAAFLHGSQASGKAGAGSDVDLILVVDQSDLRGPARSRALGPLEDYDGPEPHPVVLTRAEFLRYPPLTYSLTIASRIAYSRNGEAERLLEGLRHHMRENGIARVPHAGGYYWRGIPRPG